MEREAVVKNVRACLLSAKGGVIIDNLNRDYKMLIDESIPFRKLGYPSLVAFLRTVPGVRTIEKGGDCYIEAIPSSESAHISKLISRQKSVSKKPRKKLVNARNSSSFRQPTFTKQNTRSTKGANEHFYVPLPKTKPSVPLCPVPTKITIQNDKPRYIQSTHGMPPSSPSKRLKDRQMNSAPSMNQSTNKPREDPHLKSNEKMVTPVISQKPKTVNNNIETPVQVKPSSISERLKVNPVTYPPVNQRNNNPPSSSQSEVLSPLSPGQVLAGRNIPPLLQTPINMSVPLNNVKKTVPTRPPTPDPREELNLRARALNLPVPIYQILPTKIKSAKEPAVFAQVKIGPYGYASYPDEARSESDAQKIAAKLALVDLTEKYGSPSTFNVTRDPNLIKERVLDIVDSHSNGIFMHQLPIYYKQKYKEILPGTWEKTIEKCPCVVLEKGADNSIILRRFVSPAGKTREVLSPKSEKIQLNPIGPAVPGQLQLPTDEFWVVSITYITSTVDVWARFIGDAYSEQLELMTAEMSQHYSRLQQPIKPLAVEVGNYYAVFVDEYWHRVRCIDYNPDSGEATVTFIDMGDEDTFPYNKLQPLDKKFCALSAQAIRLCLYGLEDFSDCDSILSLLENRLLDHSLYVEVISRDVDNNGPFVTAVLYDTSGPDDVNVNQELSKQISQHVIIAPKLDAEGQLSEVFISYVEENGDIYVQIQSESMKLLVSLLNRLVRTGLNADEFRVTTIDRSKIYFVSVNNNWYRGKVIDDRSPNQLRVFLIDFGKTVTTGKNNLLSLERLSEVLSKYPAQALKVRLHNIDKSMFNEKMVAKLTKLAPKGERLLVKVVSPKSDAPVVELFKRIEPSNMLVSINNTLALEEKLARSDGDGNNNVKPRKRIERMNSRLSGNEDEEAVKSLKPPHISGIDDFFDVHVTMAAHPGYFVVQPFDEKKALENMMIELQETCHAYKGSPPAPETIREGKLYAGEHTDGHWYRVCISSIMTESMYSVYFCDFGDVSVFQLHQLQPLKSQFLELPYQAIRARLVGIQPINGDWSVKDVSRFQELVVEKNFVSIVKECEPDELSPTDTILGLKLIDVNTFEDIYIDQLLVNEGRATFVD